MNIVTVKPEIVPPAPLPKRPTIWVIVELWVDAVRDGETRANCLWGLEPFFSEKEARDYLRDHMSEFLPSVIVCIPGEEEEPRTHHVSMGVAEAEANNDGTLNHPNPLKPGEVPHAVV